ncbi:hypothetical protein ACFX5U_12360 [Sphingobacterium sp. SG20118]|uniref:hypothetical protein n=1 Tax=Sphingobacterium sp. SG20118 TaxID=3367156 RepID=UPI0037DFC566
MKLKVLIILLHLSCLNVIAQEINDDKDRIFTNKNIENLYLGAIMKISSLNADNYEFIEAPNLPAVDILETADVTLIVPSRSAMIKYILKDIEGDDLSVIVSESLPNTRKVASYENLGAIFGQKINAEIMLAVNPKAKNSKSLYAARFTNLIYSLSCMPDFAKAKAHAAMKGLDPKDFMYVDGISFGRAASIFIESDADYETIKTLIDKKYLKRELTEQDEAILANSTIHFQISDTKQVNLLDGDPFEIIRHYMTTPITKEDFLRPIWFTGSDLKDGDMVYTP